MWKGPIILIIGIVLALLSVPFIFGYTLYDERTIQMYDLDEYDSDDEVIVYGYEFEDINPGKITVRARDILLGGGSVHVQIDDMEDGETVKEFDMDPGAFFWAEKEAEIGSGGDYELIITVEEPMDSYIELQVKYSAKYSRLGLIAAILGFPAFLIAGISGIIWGTVLIYRKKRGIEKNPDARYNDLYESEAPDEDEKKVEWEEYETSPWRKELWYEPMTNPYDDVPPDYYAKKVAEGRAFNKKWHQRWGDELEERLVDRIDKKKEREKGPKQKNGASKRKKVN